MLLNVKKINVEVENKKILNDFFLEINSGEIHAIRGAKGVRKSTLSRVMMGDNNYKLLSGDVLFNNESILGLKTDERARLGIFLAMQYPTEIPGISNQDFLRTAMAQNDDKRIGLYEFILKCEKASEELKMNKSLIHRDLNCGFSGGEKKKNEILQMMMLKPKFIILDELDSGLDVDSLRIVCENINTYLKENPDTSVLIITHYTRVLKYIKPDYVHVMREGRIVKTGTMDLAYDIEKTGYNGINVMIGNESNE